MLYASFLSLSFLSPGKLLERTTGRDVPLFLSFLLLSLEGRFLLPSPPVTPFSVAPPMGGRGATPPLKLSGEEGERKKGNKIHCVVRKVEMTLHLREGVKRRESKKKGGGLKEEERGGEDWERTERRQERKEEEGEERKGVWVRVDKRGGEKKRVSQLT